jgi:cytoskeleton protein RodZ
VFEIGNSLREARLRQGLDFPKIEADTKIRGKYLRAIEEERFEVLPGETYVKGFLRSYAEYLGLDGQLYVDEYNSRFTTAEEPQAAPSARRRTQRPRIESNFVVVALAGIVAVTVLVVVGLAGLGPGEEPTATTPLVPTNADSTTSTEATPQPSGKRKGRLAKLALSAAGGNCWVQVRAGSARGDVLWEGTIEDGQTQRFTKWRRLWLSLGSPAGLRAKLNGRVVRDFPDAQSVVLVTAKGVRTLSTA